MIRIGSLSNRSVVLNRVARGKRRGNEIFPEEVKEKIFLKSIFRHEPQSLGLIVQWNIFSRVGIICTSSRSKIS